MLFFLSFSLLFCPIVRTKFNLYNTDPKLDLDHLQVNCLHYYRRSFEDATEETEYCLGPIEINSFDDIDHHHINRILTFDQLRQLNVDITELLSWSSTIDLAENYQYYLDYQNDSVFSKEMFFNCTQLWFGPQCQYSFDVTEVDSFEQMVLNTLKKRSN